VKRSSSPPMEQKIVGSNLARVKVCNVIRTLNIAMLFSVTSNALLLYAIE
jgi:multisubunit Na+/H+ antiporter MnhF subunit